MAFAYGLDRIASALFPNLLDSHGTVVFTDLLIKMKSFEQRKYLDAMIHWAIKQYLSSDHVSKDDAHIPASKPISSVAALFYSIIKGNDLHKEHFVSILTRSTIPSLDDSLAARRSVIAALATDPGWCN